jgi:hypothetical protein
MTDDENRVREQSVDAILKGVAKKTALLVSLATAASLVYAVVWGSDQRWWLLPASILFGGALGLLNFRWLAVSVQRVYLRQGATVVGSNLAAVVISLLKLSFIFFILFIVIKWQLLPVFGLVAGLSLCFTAIIGEGATVMKQTLNSDGK